MKITPEDIAEYQRIAAKISEWIQEVNTVRRFRADGLLVEDAQDAIRIAHGEIILEGWEYDYDNGRKWEEYRLPIAALDCDEWAPAVLEERRKREAEQQALQEEMQQQEDLHKLRSLAQKYGLKVVTDGP